MRVEVRSDPVKFQLGVLKVDLPRLTCHVDLPQGTRRTVYLYVDKWETGTPELHAAFHVSEFMNRPDVIMLGNKEAEARRREPVDPIEKALASGEFHVWLSGPGGAQRVIRKGGGWGGENTPGVLWTDAHVRGFFREGLWTLMRTTERTVVYDEACQWTKREPVDPALAGVFNDLLEHGLAVPEDTQLQRAYSDALCLAVDLKRLLLGLPDPK